MRFLNGALQIARYIYAYYTCTLDICQYISRLLSDISIMRLVLKELLEILLHLFILKKTDLTTIRQQLMCLKCAKTLLKND